MPFALHAPTLIKKTQTPLYEDEPPEWHTRSMAHPRGWATSRRCEALAARNPRLCLRCHVDFREVSCDSVRF